MRFIGDVHGRMKDYQYRISDCKESIQVGDMGVGFVKIPEIDTAHKFIRGNHDNPNKCAKSLNFIPDGSFNKEFGMFFLGGGESIDKAYRIEGKSWWPGEELSVKSLQYMIDRYAEYKPNIMITHDCPQIAANALFSHHQMSSRTRQALDAMLEIHSPKLWIFGHHHVFKIITINGTEFIALEELGFIDIDLEKYNGRSAFQNIGDN